MPGLLGKTSTAAFENARAAFPVTNRAEPVVSAINELGESLKRKLSKQLDDTLILRFGSRSDETDYSDSRHDDGDYESTSKSYFYSDNYSCKPNTSQPQPQNGTQNDAVTQVKIDFSGRSLPSNSPSSNLSDSSVIGGRVEEFWLLEGHYYSDEATEKHDGGTRVSVYDDVEIKTLDPLKKYAELNPIIRCIPALAP